MKYSLIKKGEQYLDYQTAGSSTLYLSLGALDKVSAQDLRKSLS